MSTVNKLQRILDSKLEIKESIEYKGVSVGDTPLSEYDDKIKRIEGGGSGTTDYNLLDNLPILNGITIKGSLTLEELGINIPQFIPISSNEIDKILL